MRIRAVSVFEGVVYHCWLVDGSTPCRPQLEVEALLRPGDADADAGPLLLSVGDYIVFAGGIEVARPCLEELRAAGRIVPHLGADHIAFPTWTRVGGEDHTTAGHDPTPTDGTSPDGPPTLQVLPGGRDDVDPADGGPT